MLEQDWRLAVVVLCVLGAAIAGLYAMRRTAWSFGAWGPNARSFGAGRDSALLAVVLNNITQGVVMFDAAERLVVCNDRYIEMYGLSRDVVKPGCTFLDVINNRKTTGDLDIDIAKYRTEVVAAMKAGKTLSGTAETPNGRVISVINRPIAGNAFWLGTHDDITERVLAERQSTFLMEHERRREFIESEIHAFRNGVETVLQTVSESTSTMRKTAT